MKRLKESSVKRHNGLVLAALFAGGVSAQADGPSAVSMGSLNINRLRYEEPAKQWDHALPLGNGRLGAMVFGSVEKERIGINEDTFYALEPDTAGFVPDIRPSYDQVVSLIKTGRFAEAEDLVRKQWLGRSNAPYLPVGDLWLDFGHKGDVQDYRYGLDLATAVVKTSYRYNGVAYRREAFVSHPDQVLVVRLETDQPGALSFTASLDTPHKPTSTLFADGDTLVLKGQGPGEALRRSFKKVESLGDQRKYPAFYGKDGKRLHDKNILYGDEVDGRGTFFDVRIHVETDAGTVAYTDDKVVVTGATGATLLLAIDTSFNGIHRSPSRKGVDPAVASTRDLTAASGLSYEKLLERHLADYQPLFNRFSIDLGTTPAAEMTTTKRVEHPRLEDDPALAALYCQYGRYLMIAGSRPGTQPLNLQGIWSRTEEVIPPWNGAYTCNINAQMNYWPAERGNLSELHEPLLRMVEEVSRNGRKVARSMFGNRGWCMSHNTSIWRSAAPVDNQPKASWWPVGGAWFCQHIWTHYEYTADRAFLERMYPVLVGAAEFFCDWLVDRGDGALVTPVSISPENQFLYAGKTSASVSMGATMDQAMIRELFSNTLTAARVLGKSNEVLKEIRAKRDAMAGYEIGERGQLQEWDQDFREREPTHRHISHLYPFHPGREINRQDTPELVDAVRKSLELRGDGGTGWATAWKINQWARLGDGNRAHSLLTGLLTPKRSRPNLFDLCPPFQIDGNFGGCAGIMEMLVQDHLSEPGSVESSADGIGVPLIQLLPALPDAWPEGEVRGIRCRGGVEIELLRWENGRVIECRIRTDRDVRFTIKCGSALFPVRLGAGKQWSLPK
jgi:alpha-L-fucosidase 2